MSRRRRVPAVLAALAVLASAACGATADASGGPVGSPVTLSLVAYSTPQEAYQDLIPAFARSAAGHGIRFTQSYGASGAQSRAIAAGLPTDVAALSLSTDIDSLVKAGLVAADWDAGPYRGMVTDSVVVLVVRKGNPRHIRGWADLVRPGIRVVTPNPFSSGGARWNILAAYGAQLKAGRSPAQAADYLDRLFHHVVVQDTSGRAALQTFAAGTGDVLISYENEAYTARQKGIPVDVVRPPATVLIENPAAVLSASRHPAAARAFLDWLHTDAAQRIFAAHGYRPVVAADRDPARFPTPPQLFTIDDLGGWSAVDTTLFDPQHGLLARIEHEVGVSAG